MFGRTSAPIALRLPQKVTSIKPLEQEREEGKSLFKLSLSESSPCSTIYARYVIYAGGEYGHPYMPPFAVNNKSCLHYSTVEDWGDRAKGSWVVVGGGEAGIDAALTLYENIEKGEITVIDKVSTPKRAEISGIYRHIHY